MSGPKMRSDFSKFNDFVKNIADASVVRIGVLGDKAARKGGGDMSNADIGAAHEFGSPERHIPRRSFLRMPLQQKAEQIVKETGRTNPEELVTKGKGPMLRRLGVSAQGVVLDAFATGGFGQWAPNAYSTILAKLRRSFPLAQRRQMAAETLHEGATGHTSPLIDTGELRRSISYAVIKR